MYNRSKQLSTEMSLNPYRVFISHLDEDKAAAHLLAKTLRLAFGVELTVFVSSDEKSIGPGPWYTKIVEALRSTEVVIVILSHESSRRLWVNFEAGAGVSRNIPVIPVTLSRLSVADVLFPLRGLQIRRMTEIGILLQNVAEALKEEIGDVDNEVYLRELAAVESGLTYKSLAVTPVVAGSQLFFDIENNGNTDVELLMLEFLLPAKVVDAMWLSMHQNIDRQGRSIGSNGYFWLAYYAPRGAVGPVMSTIRPVLTKGMGKYRPHVSVKLIWEEIAKVPQDYIFSYQLHAVNYPTAPQECLFSDVFTS